jgi:exocyst complex component 6
MVLRLRNVLTTELENVHINEIIQFDFAEVIRQTIPATRQVLQDSVLADLKEWLLKIRQSSQLIGDVAIQHAEKKRDEWQQVSQNNAILSTASFNSALERVYNEQDDC